MIKISELIIQQVFREIAPTVLRVQAKNGLGFWMVADDEHIHYYLLGDLVVLYPDLSRKDRCDIELMITQADLTQQAVISFRLPKGDIAIDTFTIE